MNKFWDYMKEKYYKDYILLNNKFFPAAGDTPRQMLIGFMIEYISTHKWWEKKKNEEAFGAENRTIDLEFEFRMSVWHRNIFDELERIIKILDKEK